MPGSGEGWSSPAELAATNWLADAAQADDGPPPPVADGVLTISRTHSNNRADYVTVRLMGRNAPGRRRVLVDVELSLESLALALTGAQAECHVHYLAPGPAEVRRQPPQPDQGSP